MILSSPLATRFGSRPRSFEVPASLWTRVESPASEKYLSIEDIKAL